MLCGMDTVTNPYRLAEHRRASSYGTRPPPRRTYVSTTPQDFAPGERLLARDGTPLVLRLIRASDVQALQRGFDRLTPEEVRMRFLHPLNMLPEPFARELCELDPARAVAWVLADPDAAPRVPEIHAVARAYVDPVLDQAEFAIVVEGRYARQGFGTLLMHRVIDSARKLGATELWGDVLLDNQPMLDLCERLGFTRNFMLHDPGVMRVTLAL
ncbi:MAG: N-acetyltransferase [Gammaproteobacteria bacterium]|nr:MAG: N-acetyltransferase [Gammaproteobacteria bacterium]